MMSGDLEFWPGLVGMLRGGYGRTPYVGGAIARLGLPGIRFCDGPRGVTLGQSTCFPVSMARGATWDVELEERVGAAMGAEARAQGANLIGSVCVNLLHHPAWGRAQETYGEDPCQVGEMGAAAVRGLQRHVMACVKHFALNNMENARFQVDVTASPRVLHEVYLRQFRRCVDEGAACVMSAYNSVNGELVRAEPGAAHRDPAGAVGLRRLRDHRLDLRDARRRAGRERRPRRRDAVPDALRPSPARRNRCRARARRPGRPVRPAARQDDAALRRLDPPGRRQRRGGASPSGARP